MSLLLADGSVATRVEELASQVMRENLRERADEWQPVSGHRHLAIAELSEPKYNGQPIYLSAVGTTTGKEMLFQIVTVIVTFYATRLSVDMSLTHGEYDGTPYSTGTAGVGEYSMQFVWTEDGQGNRAVMARLDPS